MTLHAGALVALLAIALTADIDAGWHLYAMTQPPGGPKAMTLTIAGKSPFTLVGPIDAPLPRVAFDSNFNIDTQFHEDKTVFTAPVRIAAKTAGSPTLTVIVSYQVCNDRLCLPPRTEKFTLGIAVGRTRR